MPLQPETPPSPMPGAKKSAPDKGDPRADTNNNSNAAKPDPDRGNNSNAASKDSGDKETSKLTAEEQAHLDTHVSVLQKLVGGKPSMTGNKQEESALNDVNTALQTPPNLDQ